MPRQRRAPGEPRRATAARRRSPRGAGRRDVAGRAVEHDPAGVDRDDPRAQRRRAGRSCARRSAATCRRPRACAERLADQPRPGRVELGRRLVEDRRGAAASRAARRSRRAGPGRRTAAAGRAELDRLDAEQGDRARASARRSRPPARPRFIGPSATSSKTVAAIPERCVFGFWKPTTTRLASSCVFRPAIGSPSIVSVPVSAPPIDAGREPGGDEAERRLAGLVRPDQPDDLAVGEREVDVVEDRLRVAGVAVRDAVQLEHRPPLSGSRDGNAPVSRRRSSRPGAAAAQRGRRAGAAESGHPPEQVAPAGPAERAGPRARRLRSSTSVSEDRITGPDQRQDAAEPGAEAALRVEAAGAAALAGSTPARSTIAGTASSVAQRDEREPRREAPPLEVEDEARADRWSGRTARSTVEIANSRTSVWPAKSTPSAVASNGPIEKSTVVAGPGEHARRGRPRSRSAGVSRNETRTSRPATPATTRAGEVEDDDRERPDVAADDEARRSSRRSRRRAFVSGFRRWYGTGRAGGAQARAGTRRQSALIAGYAPSSPTAGLTLREPRRRSGGSARRGWRRRRRT